MIANRHGRTFSLFSPVLLLGSLWGSSRPRGDVTSTVAQLAKRKKRATDRVLLPREASRRKECRGFDGKSTDEFLEFPQCIYPLPREFVVHRSILFRVEEAMHNALDFFFFFAFTYPQNPVAGIEGIENRCRTHGVAISRDLEIPFFSFSLSFPSYFLSLPRCGTRGGPKIGAGQRLKAGRDSLARSFGRGSGSNESMKNNTCPGPAAKIVNAARYYA